MSKQEMIQTGFEVDGEVYMSAYFTREKVLRVYGPLPKDTTAGPLAEVHTVFGQDHEAALNVAKSFIEKKNSRKL